MEECIEKLGRTLGTLINVDEEIIDGDSYLYLRIQVGAVCKIQSEILLCVDGEHRVILAEVEEDRFFCLRCGSKSHSKNN